MSPLRATLIGGIAILCWSALAALAVATTPVPPFALNTFTFAIGGAAGLVWCAMRGRLGVLRAASPRLIAFGTAGLFGYHALYFSALRLAPPVEASLVAFLWPLLIVVFAGLLLGERLRAGHIAGALLGFCGAAVAMSGASGTGGGLMAGHILALLCAVTWALYSVLSRKAGEVPSEVVTLFCLGTALLSLPCHLLFETPALPAAPAGWLSILALGLGPVGLAFFAWDVGVKHGDIGLLGTLSYLAPVLSTALLIATGAAPATARIAVAAVLLVGGAALALRASAAERAPLSA